jgi:hypothetical protein
MSLEEILLESEIGKEFQELSTLENFSEVLDDVTGIDYPKNVQEYFFKKRKMDLKRLLRKPYVRRNAPDLFQLLEPYGQILDALKWHFGEKVFEMILSFPSDFTLQKINTWFSCIESVVGPVDPRVDQAKRHILSVLKLKNPLVNLSEVLEQFTGDYCTAGTIIGKGQGIPDQMDIGFIFVRHCYTKLYDNIVIEGERGPVLVCGDPGIGKSYFGLYVFCRLTSSQARSKVIRFTISGDWIEFDGEQFRNGHGWSSSNWRDDETWLLLDGNEHLQMLNKRSRVVLFASPQKRNYHHFMKNRNAVAFYMPEWDLTEIEDLVKKIHLTNLQAPSPFFELVDRSKPLKPASEKKAENQEKERSPLFKPSENSKTVEEAVLDIVKERYELVGGRIRDVLASGVTTAMLTETLSQAVKSLSFQDLSNVLGVQVESSFPSIVYKIIPDENDPRLFQTGMCSARCTKLIIQTMIQQRKATAAELFFVFNRMSETKVACGNVFETISLRGLETGVVFAYRSFNHKSPIVERIPAEMAYGYNQLIPDENNTRNPATGGYSANSTIQFDYNNLVVQEFDSKDKICSILKNVHEHNATKNILLKPSFSNQELFDSLYFKADEKILYLLQMTIAVKHNLDFEKLNGWMRKIASCLNNQRIRTEYVFVVPKHLFPSYGIGDLAIKEKTSDKLTQNIQTKIHLIDEFLNTTSSCLFKVLGVNVEQIGYNTY